MKFVANSLHRLRKTEAGYFVRIARWHKAAIGLVQDSYAWAVPIPKSRDVIITFFDPKSWGDLWKVSATVQDTPGSLLAVVKSLSRRKANVLTQESISEVPGGRGFVMPARPGHSVQFIVDLHGYTEEEGDVRVDSIRRSDAKFLSAKPNRLIAAVEEDLQHCLLSRGNLDGLELKFERVEFYFRNMYDDMPEARIIADGSHVALPRSVVQRAVNTEDVDELICQVSSDTEDKYIRINFLDNTIKTVVLKIIHREARGAIAKFCEIIAKEDGNLLSSYMRLSKMGETSVWYCTLNFPRGNEVKALGTILRSLMEDSRLNPNTERGFGYVQSVSVGPDIGFAENEVREIVRSLGQDTVSYREERSERPIDLVTRYMVPVIPADAISDEIKFGIRPIHRGLRDVRSDDAARKRKRVFVGLNFDDQGKRLFNELLKPVIESHGGEAVRIDEWTGDGPVKNIYDEIHSQIIFCDCVVADMRDINPNVVYEAGIALALGKPLVLTIDQNTKDTKWVSGRPPFDLSVIAHTVYDMDDLAGATAQLSSQIQRRLDELDNWRGRLVWAIRK
jgi:hypothetical protein